MTITGQNNLNREGDFLIFNKVTLKILLAMEKEIGQNNVFYLMEESCPLDPAIEHYFSTKSAAGISFLVDHSDLRKLSDFLKEKLKEGKTVIYLPGRVSFIKGAIHHIPEYILEALGDLNIPPTPVHVGFYTNTVLKAEVPHESDGTAKVTILPKLAEGPYITARLGAAWLENSANVFGALPQLHGSLGSNLIYGMKQHMNARLIDGIDDTSTTFGKLLGAAIAFSKRLKQITSDRRIGIILPPGKGATIANLACIFSGKVPVNINYSNSEDAFKSSIKQAAIERFITADTFMRKLQAFPWPPLRDLIFVEREIKLIKSSVARWVFLAAITPAHLLVKLLKTDEYRDEDEGILLFTSGSSSEPKGVPLSYHNILTNIAQCDSRIVLTNKGRFLSSLPVFHGFGITIGLFFPLMSGHDFVTYPSPLESKRLGELIKLYKTEIVVSTPTFLRGFIKRCPADTFESVNYLIVGAEKLPQDLADSFFEKFNVAPMEGYGLSEASPVCSVNFKDPLPKEGVPNIIRGMKKHSVGSLLPGMAVRITDPMDGTVVPITNKGMIWLKGGNIFSGYVGLPHLNREIFVDGWFKTGDVGYADPQGFLWIEGRLARFSKIAGEMVSHEAVEQAIMKALNLDPSDEERHIAVVSIPDDQRGEAIALLSTLVKDFLHQERMAIRYALLDQNHPALWCPKEIIPVKSIPVLPTGKLDLAKCKEIAYKALKIPYNS